MHQNGWLFPYQSSCYNNIIYHVMNTEKSQYRRTMSRNVASLNTFVPNAPFLYPLKTTESLMVFWCFQGMAKGCIGNELVKLICPWRDEFITLWILNRQKKFLRAAIVTLREKCPNTEFFLARIFLYSDWIRRFTEMFSPSTGKCGPEKAPYVDTFHVMWLVNSVNISKKESFANWCNSSLYFQTTGIRILYLGKVFRIGPVVLKLVILVTWLFILWAQSN